MIFICFTVAVAVCCGLVAFIIWKYSLKKSYWISRGVTFLDSSKLYSMVDRLRLKYEMHELEQLLYKEAKKQGISTYAGVIDLGSPALYVLDFDLIKNILIKDFDNFVDRRTFNAEKTDPLFHKMMVNMKGQEWKNLRSTISPTFTTGKIRRMYSSFNESSEKLAMFLRTLIKSNSDQELRNIFARYTVQVISSAAFGLDSQSFSKTDSEFTKYAKRFQNQFSGINALKFVVVFLFPKLMQFLRIPFLDQGASNFFTQVTRKTIQHRETTGEKRNDFLQLLMEARIQSDIPVAAEVEMSTFEIDAQIQSAHAKVLLTEEYILAQSLLFFMAGFDTIETLLVLTAYELALNQEVQERLHHELSNAWDGINGSLSYDLVMKLEYLEMVVSEVLRKWPPGIRLERKSTKEYKLPNSDFVLEKDTLVLIPVYAIHHDEMYYPNPEKFDPERFTAENKSKRNPYTYLPFGAGPRNCIAMRFALAEGKAAIAHLILNFKFEPSVKTQIPMKFNKWLSFKPEKGLWLHVTSRV